MQTGENEGGKKRRKKEEAYLVISYFIEVFI